MVSKDVSSLEGTKLKKNLSLESLNVFFKFLHVYRDLNYFRARRPARKITLIDSNGQLRLKLLWNYRRILALITQS